VAAADLAAIDWAAPWLAALRATGEPLAQRVLNGASCAQALNAAPAELLSAAGIRFVAQAALPEGEAYEAFIFRTRQVPTRDGLHDFFNGLCWLHFPRTKNRLNQLQAAHITLHGIGPQRGAARDALTVFDENAAFLSAPDALWDALQAKDWSALFGSLRSLWAQSHLQLFGHALFEKLCTPRKAMTAHVYRVRPADGACASFDSAVADTLSAALLESKPFAHLPVLGVPGWHIANKAPDFYRDASVFRVGKPQALYVITP
jgi:Protein of unknown function (DUF3025)